MTCPTTIASGTNRGRALLFLLLLVLTGQSTLSQNPSITSSGRLFYVALPAIASGPNAELVVSITAIEAGEVTVEHLGESSSVLRNLAPGETTEVRFQRPRIAVTDRRERREERRSIKVTSTGNIVVAALYDTEFLAEGWRVPPVEDWGREHRAVSLSQNNVFGSILLVIARDDSTIVRIRPSVATEANGLPGFEYSVVLDEGDVYQVVPKIPELSDLSGTRIVSSKPVSVMSGHAGGNLFGLGAANPMIESIPPVDFAGRTYFSRPFPGQLRGLYKVVALEDDTRIALNGPELLRLDAGESDWMTLEGTAHFIANRPILVGQFLSHFRDTIERQDGDPSMTVLTPIDGWTHDFAFDAPRLTTRNVAINGEIIALPFEHWAVVTLAGDGENDRIELDGVDVSRFLSSSFAGTGLRHALLRLDDGPHILSATRPASIQLIGRNRFDAYAMPAGYAPPPALAAEPVERQLCDSAEIIPVSLNNLIEDSLAITIRMTSDESISVIGETPVLLGPRESTEIFVEGAVPTGVRLSGTITVDVTNLKTGRTRLQVIEIVLLGPPRKLEVSTDTLRFPILVGNGAEALDSIVLYNRSARFDTVRQIPVSLPFILESPPLPTVIAPGDSLRFLIRYAPPPGRQRDTATLSIITDPCQRQFALTLIGERTERPAITTSSDTLRIECASDSARPAILKILHHEGESISIDSMRVSGGGRTDHPFPVVLGQSESIDVPVFWSGFESGCSQLNVELYIDGIATPIDASVVRCVSIVELAIDPEEIDFGTILVCTEDSVITRGLAFRNRGDVPLVVSSAENARLRFEPHVIPVGSDTSVSVSILLDGVGRNYHDTLFAMIEPCRSIRPIVVRGTIERSDLRVAPVTVTGVVGCSLPESVKIRLTNTGSRDDTVRSVVDPSGIIDSLRSDTGLVVHAGESLEILLPYDIGALDSASTLLRVAASGCKELLIVPVEIQKNQIAASLSEATVRLSDVIPEREYSASVVLRDDGTTPLRLTLLDGPLPDGLDVTLGSTDLADNGEESTVSIRYRSDAPRRISYVQLIEFRDPISGCRDTVSLNIEITPGDVEITWELKKVIAEVDRVVEVPLELVTSTITTDRRHHRFRVAWFSSALFLDETPISTGDDFVLTSITSERVGDSTIATFDLEGPTIAGTTVAHLRLIPYLSHGTDWPLDLSFIPTGVPVFDRTVTIDGHVAIDGICPIDGLRLLQQQIVHARIKRNRPGASPLLQLDNLGADRSSVSVVIGDVHGRTVVGRSFELGPGSLSVMLFESLRTPSGLYYVRIEADGGEIFSKPLVFVR